MTKVLFLLAAALTFLMSGLVVAYASNADRLKAEWNNERQRAQQAETLASSLTTDVTNQIAQLEADKADLRASMIANEERVVSFQRENANLLARVNELAREKVGHSGQIDQFTAVMQVYARLSDAQSQELNDLRDNQLDQARREIDLTDRINDLTGQLEVAQETMRSLMEQNQGLREQLALSGGSPGSSLASTNGFARPSASSRPPANFQTRVTGVDQGAGGVTLVEIAAGANDQLAEGMELILVRGSAFLGKVILQRVTPNESVGRVDFLGKSRTTPQLTDVVRSSSL